MASRPTDLPVVPPSPSDAWALLGAWLGSPLHPGGRAATEALLDRAGVQEGTRMLDLGCGDGAALHLARERGADAVGLDAAARTGVAGRTADGGTTGGPAGPALCTADLTRVPFADATFDVVLSECALCLAGDLPAALAEARRVLTAGPRPGRLALSDVTLEAPLDGGAVPRALARLLCIEEARPAGALVVCVEEAGFTAVRVEDRTGDLRAMRDRLRRAVDVDGLLAALGPRADAWRRGLAAVEEALADGRLGYAALVAERT